MVLLIFNITYLQINLKVQEDLSVITKYCTCEGLFFFFKFLLSSEFKLTRVQLTSLV